MLIASCYNDWGTSLRNGEKANDSRHDSREIATLVFCDVCVLLASWGCDCLKLLLVSLDGRETSTCGALGLLFTPISPSLA